MSRILRSTLLVVRGVPGILIVLTSSAMLFLAVAEPREFGGPDRTLALIGRPTGLVLSSIGIGKLNQWRCALVVLAVPATFLVLVGLLFVDPLARLIMDSKVWAPLAVSMACVLAVVVALVTLRYARARDKIADDVHTTPPR